MLPKPLRGLKTPSGFDKSGGNEDDRLDQPDDIFRGLIEKFQKVKIIFFKTFLQTEIGTNLTGFSGRGPSVTLFSFWKKMACLSIDTSDALVVK